jgi:hypothetical protein
MTKATIFGKGNMGGAIAGILAAGGTDVEHIDTSSENAIVNGDIVILAVPYAALSDIAAKYGDQLAGKTVVDITNPVDFTTFQLAVPADSSAAAELAAALPASTVLKAFNTNLAGSLAAKSVGQNRCNYGRRCRCHRRRPPRCSPRAGGTGLLAAAAGHRSENRLHRRVHGHQVTPPHPSTAPHPPTRSFL